MYIVFLVLLNALFVMAECSLAMIRKGQILEMKAQGFDGADILLRIFDQRNHYISAAQVGISCTSLLLGWYGGPFLAKWILSCPELQEIMNMQHQIPLIPAGSEASTISILCVFLILVMLHVVIGELIPRMIVWDRVEIVIQHMGTFLRVIYALTFPFVSIAFFLAKGIAHLLGVRYFPREDISYSEEELRQIVIASEEEGELDSAERTMIDNVFSFDDIVAREVMVPRQDMVCLYVEDSMEEIRKVIRTNNYTRFPVCEKDKDHVLGVLHIRDLFNAEITPDFDIRSLVRKTIMVPDSMNAQRVLQTMQKQRIHIALVLDEYGGTAGLVTLEDLIEEIVGDIRDEPEVPEVLLLPDGSYNLDGEMLLEDVGELLSLSFELRDEDDTLGGYIFSRLGRKPEEGDEIRWKNWRFAVLKVNQFRIERVQAEKIESDGSDEG